MNVPSPDSSQSASAQELPRSEGKLKKLANRAASTPLGKAVSRLIGRAQQAPTGNDGLRVLAEDVVPVIPPSTEDIAKDEAPGETVAEESHEAVRLPRGIDAVPPVQRDHITFLFTEPPANLDADAAVQEAERLLFPERNNGLQGMMEAEMKPEVRVRMEQTYALARSIFLKQVQELGIDYDESNLPGFDNIHFYNGPLTMESGGTLLSGAFYDTKTHQMNMIMQPNESPLSTAMHMVHEFRHAAATHDVDIQFSYFRPDHHPSYFRKQGITYLENRFLFSGEWQNEVRGKMIDNALSIDFQEQVYEQIGSIFPEEVAARKQAIEKNDTLLRDLIDVSTYSTNTSLEQIKPMAEALIEQDANGEYILSKNTLLNLLILQELYRRIDRRGNAQIDARTLFERESLSHFDGTNPSGSAIMDALEFTTGRLILGMTDHESSQTLGEMLLILENDMLGSK